MVLALLPNWLAIQQSCTADLVATSISWEAGHQVDKRRCERGKRNDRVAFCGKYKVSLRFFLDFNVTVLIM